jgi:predicted ATPase
MLTKLHISGFKNWRDSSEIRLAPLTVFFGTNSSGKSSLLQFLLMLRQTSESPDRRRVIHLGDQSTPVELGTFRDTAYGHDLTRPTEFSFDWNLPSSLKISDPLTDAEFVGKSISFSCAVAFDQKGQAPRVTKLEYELHGSSDPLRVSLKAKDAQGSSWRQFQIESTPYKLVRNQGRPWALPEPIRFYGFPEEVSAYYQNASFTSDLAFSLEEELRRIQYLGPLRTNPKRSYIWSGEIPDHVGWSGDRVVEAVLAATDRRIGSGYKKPKVAFQVVIAKWLKTMGLLESFTVRPIAEHRKDYEVLVKTSHSTTEVTLPDVGFGVSQVLPVIVECFYAQPNTTVLLEQPEIHLHPSVQSALADLFIETVQSKENGTERAVQLIVESHSEHLLRRLQRRVAEGAIRPEQVALYFCKRGQNGSVIEPLEINLFGDIKNWPDDFFGDEMGEITARLDAAAANKQVAS